MSASTVTIFRYQIYMKVDSSVAVGSASDATNLFVVKCQPSSAQPFEVTATFENTYPIFSVDWEDDKILCGCDKNYVQLCKIDGRTIQDLAQYPHIITQVRMQ